MSRLRTMKTALVAFAVPLSAPVTGTAPGNAPAGAPAAAVAPAPAAPAPPPAAGDLPERDFALKLEARVLAADAAAFDRVLDYGAVLDRAMAGIAGSPDLARQFRDTETRQASFGRSIVEAVKRGASFRFLRVRKGEGGRTQALFRLLNPQGGVNYYDLALGRGAAGEVRIVDTYVFAAGEWRSDQLRRNWIVAVGVAGLGGELEAGSIEALTVANIDRIDRIDRIQRKQAPGEDAAALGELLALPAPLQATKNLLVLRAGLARRVSDQAYADAVDAFARAFPGDPALDLLLLDVLIARGQHDAALQAIERLSRATGGEAYLEMLRGNVYALKQDLGAARAALEKAVLLEPTLVEPYQGLLRIALLSKDHVETARLLSLLERDFQLSYGDLAARPEFASFVATEAHARWSAARGRPPAGDAGAPHAADASGPAAAPTPVRVGDDVKAPTTIREVTPVYSEIAKAARVQGMVEVECTISAEGRVTDTRVLSGPPLLVQPALDAIRQWEYTPTLVKGIAVPVILTVTVRFKLE